RFYGSEAPLLPLIFRAHGVATRAFVENTFMSGYAPVGLDLGFERVFDYRPRAPASADVTSHAIAWIRANRGARFFVFCAYDAKNNDAVGALVRTLDETGLRERTIVVVAVDRGETTHGEALRVPLLVSLPGVLGPRI